MADGTVLDREEYIEQVYLFRNLRERLASNMAAQEILERIHEELLSTTRLPLAVQFLATEMKHTGLLASGFARLPHYFTPYQTFLVRQAEDEKRRFDMTMALLVLEREAEFRANHPPSPANRPGLFVYQFEVISRNRLSYDDGLRSMAADPYYDADWRAYLELVRRQVGLVDFTDLVYLRSELYVTEQCRLNPDYVPPAPPIFGEKEGKIAKANRGRDPLFLFAALQRQLGYPEVPRPRPRDDWTFKLEALHTKLRELEARLKLLEGETRGQIDLIKQLGKPELLRDLGDKDD
ncbi:MAG: hypothetical protein NZ700_00950 [Gemmataceae bacterium]|nr:hypothetical protein [Gemmataceae bacterium]MDW8265784.1 hypothetical protein [Gemmataceae bacterium]